MLDSMAGKDQFIAKTIHDYLAEEWKTEVVKTDLFSSFF